MSHDREDLNAIREDLDAVLQANRDLLIDEPRIRRPLEQARDAAKTKYEDLTEAEARRKAQG
jgi:hypothetical protein